MQLLHAKLVLGQPYQISAWRSLCMYSKLCDSYGVLLLDMLILFDLCLSD
jgi:hypothetical protein